MICIDTEFYARGVQAVTRGYVDRFYLIWHLFCHGFPPPHHSATAPSGPVPPHCRGCTITLRHTTLGRTSLDEWSACRRDLYQSTNNSYKEQTSMLLVGFETATPASDRSQIHVFDRAASGIGLSWIYDTVYSGTSSNMLPYIVARTTAWIVATLTSPVQQYSQQL